MTDEFTTNMHFELMSEEMSELDFNIMAAYAEIRSGKKEKDVLKKYGISKDTYHKNVRRVIFNEQ
ncbi:MAG: hypothetical protein ACI30R_01960 [Sodaliphilus sp.]